MLKIKDSYLWMIVILLLTIVIAWTSYVIYTSGSQCIADPFSYSVKQARDITGKELSCTCSFDDPKISPFIYDKDGQRPLNLGVPKSIPPPNLSELISIPDN